MPESDDMLANAERALEVAARALDYDAPDAAARDAYIAALNAARAVIFEKLRLSSKTHSGTKAKFHQLVHEGMPFPANLLSFLEDGFRLKTDADYGSRKLADERAARRAVETAEAFVAHCRTIVRGA